MSFIGFATCVTPWVALVAGAQFFVAGIIHMFKPDGGKYSVAGFDVKRFDEYTHSVLMFLSCLEASSQLLRGALLVVSVWLFSEYTGALIVYDALEGLCLLTFGGYYGGGIKPLPSPPRGVKGNVPGTKLHGVKTTVMSTIGLVW
eukprot:CAMPEP_0180711884 /NCGR_PEP_ID=MMETSP1038_2-20121128/11088_1 /TAXON_ID=632150 /ORGANISM="Azadinium spinosum, Strain 3D9" /LENGTH=144 /DNA_ID=CAMNT_0022744135 /DNA_START=27 /DNA_END=458 /DNA_ORIENTATION=+